MLAVATSGAITGASTITGSSIGPSAGEGCVEIAGGAAAMGAAYSTSAERRVVSRRISCVIRSMSTTSTVAVGLSRYSCIASKMEEPASGSEACVVGLSASFSSLVGKRLLALKSASGTKRCVTCSVSGSAQGSREAVQTAKIAQKSARNARTRNQGIMTPKNQIKKINCQFIPQQTRIFYLWVKDHDVACYFQNLR